jgi:hypothetical protein
MASGQAGGNQGQVMYAQGPVFDTDIYDPATNTWTSAAKATNMRLYHSNALLLETGHVITTGSEMDNYNDYWPSAQNPNPNPNCYPRGNSICTDPFNYNIERYTPDYLGKGAGPSITNCPNIVTHGSLIQITVDSTTNVDRVTFIRYSSVTHSTNTDQRFIELVISAKTDTALFVKIPASTGMAPVGNWFLFVLNKDGVPSTAATVKLSLGSPTTATIPPGATTVKNEAASIEKTSWIAIFLSFVATFL